MRILPTTLAGRDSTTAAAKEAARALEKSGTVVYPTETVYGLGANALDEAAVEKIFRIKERTRQKPVSVAVKDIAMAKRIAVISALAEKFLKRVWPGAVTVVLKKRSVVPDILTDDGSIGLRCPKHFFCKVLFEHIDFPITSTSANISGEASLTDVKDIRSKFKNRQYRPDVVIDVGTLPPSRPSTVVDFTAGEPRVLRVGPVSAEELIHIFHNLA